ncbi:phage distal tail protein [Aeromicrobium piscarium]|uniref:Siphovirus-type tail component C-terminal domain-containing protein n=1 Tax=Aeromicrobium piscarium TaxID=2590901 RepID=A0A554SP93_9ACTN|nr:hypothetical protein [Aeromicrobium piscarium]TSD68138.1 hypothetical protein FNM00_00640 [Aeromicrobium piscarium]
MTTVVLGDSGITLGATDEYGVEWSLQEGSDLWQPKPSPRDVSGDRTVGDGAWSATEHYGPRVQQFEVHVHAPSHEELHRAHDRWRAALSLRGFRVIGFEPGFSAGRWSMMRLDGQVPWKEATPGPGRAVAATSVSLRADDPLIYSDAIRQVITGAPSTTGGLVWPASWPATWDAVVTTGVLRLTNEGSEPTPILWRLDGPASDPVVTDTRTGGRWRLALSLEAGEWITVDAATRRVLASGNAQASRRPQWSGTWMSLPPGGGEYAFTAAGTDERTRLMATTRDAWI